MVLGRQACSMLTGPQKMRQRLVVFRAAPEDEERKANMEKVPMDQLPKPHPKAFQSMQSLNQSALKTGWQKFLIDSLQSVSFTVVGDDDELIVAFAEALADKIGWLPVTSSKVVCGMNEVKKPDEMPREKLVEAEATFLKGMSKEKRVVISTIAGGASYEPETYQHLWGNFIVWIDEEDALKPKPAGAKYRKVFEKNAEIKMLLKKGKGFGKMSLTAKDKAKEHTDTLIQKLISFINSNNEIVKKKQQYVAGGCRGDWPDVKPVEDGSPLDGMKRKIVLPDVVEASKIIEPGSN